MSDGHLATKAPEAESDAVDATEARQLLDTASGQDPSEQRRAMDHSSTVASAPSGEIIQLGGIETYISKPSDYPHSPSKLLLFLTSGTGLRSVNNQLQADKYAAEGFLVIMPDLFDNDPAPNSTEPVEEGQLTLLERIKMRAVETAKSFLIDMWLARHTPAKVLPILRKTIEAAKDEFADAISSGGGIYSVGYSVGAKYTLHLASEDAFAGLEEAKADADEEAGSNERGPCIKAGAIAHGTLVTEDDFGRIKSPILMICVENDQLFPDSVRRAGEGLMLKRGVDHEVEIYPDAPHGFAVFGDYSESQIKIAQEQAFSHMVSWLKRY